MVDKTNVENDAGWGAGTFGTAATWKESAPSKAPPSAAEIAQRRSNKANHSERVRHGGNPGAGEKVR